MGCCGNHTKTTDCSCTAAGCALHGDCMACVAKHRARNEVPGCFFSEEGEKWYDRSIRALAKDKGII